MSDNSNRYINLIQNRINLNEKELTDYFMFIEKIIKQISNRIMNRFDHIQTTQYNTLITYDELNLLCWNALEYFEEDGKSNKLIGQFTKVYMRKRS